MIADDLTPLFDKPGPGLRMRQGVITAWDPATGSNTIEVAGGTLTDVSVLNTSEAIALKAGHVVVLLGQGNAWFLIGRVTPPNDPNFAGASVAFDTQTVQSTNFGLSTSLATVASVALDVPAWADEAAIYATGVLSLANPRGVGDLSSGLLAINGSLGPGSQHGFAAVGDAGEGDIQAYPVSHAITVTGPGATITCEVQARALGAAWSAFTSNSASISAMAIYRSTT